MHYRRFDNLCKSALILPVAVFLFLHAGVAESQTVPEISPQEFSKMVREMSDETGYFRGESWVTNELTYLDVLEQIEENNIKGGVYIGVAPEQNFTYIAAIRPQLAFLVDIRAQNKMQHLMFKIMFEMAETRAEFLSLLFSKPLTGRNAPNQQSNIDQIVDYLEVTRSNQELFENTYAAIIDKLNNTYQFALTDWETSNIRYVMKHFYDRNLSMTNGPWRSTYPTLAEILTDRDRRGRQLNAFNSRDHYLFLRSMHLENKIIPLTGDYGRQKALGAVADYLKKHNLTVSAQYVSNVEQYLIRNRSGWQQWVDHIRNLPHDNKTVFIRWLNWNYSYQESRLQYFSTFLNRIRERRFFNYRDLIESSHIR